MMIRALTVSLLFAVLAVPAHAQDSDPAPTSQDNPETRQTDQSEDDYRRSQRRRDVGDIFEDIGINTGSSGSGNRSLGREIKAIDRLDQESRRHLNKQRAKALAEAKPGEPIDAAYEPSDVAKTDDYVAQQEKAAWEEMMREANSGLSGTQAQGTGQGTGQGGQQGQGQSGQAGQPGGSQGQAGQGQSGQGQPGQSGSSPLRGGSASSASAILDRIKGRTGSGSSTASPSGQSPLGQSPQGQSPLSPSEQARSPLGPGQQGQSPLDSGQQGQAQAEAQAAAQAAAEAKVKADAASQAAAQAQAEAQSQATQAAQARAQAAAEAAAAAQAQVDTSAQAAQAARDAADAQAASDVNAAAEAAAHHDEPMSPLERLKRDPVDRGETGTRTSASDYLNRKSD